MNEEDLRRYAISRRQDALKRISENKFDLFHFGGCVAAGAIGSWGLRWFFDQQYVGTYLPWVLLAMVFSGLAINYYRKEKKNDRHDIPEALYIREHEVESV